jgi:hypothetical protein
MKSVRVFLIFFAIVLGLSSCKVTPAMTKSNGKVPPGQVKKVTGEKSAKSYAPGQQKKAATPPPANGQKKKK